MMHEANANAYYSLLQERNNSDCTARGNKAAACPQALTQNTSISLTNMERRDYLLISIKFDTPRKLANLFKSEDFHVD
jgi:hypothetical protein